MLNRKILLIILLLASTFLSAEWKWEQVTTFGSDSMVKSGRFHVAFNPAQNHFILTVQNGTDGVDTWMLEGRRLTLLNSGSVRYDMLDMSMFFDPTLQTMVDFRSRPLYPIAKTHVLIWDYEALNWILHEELSLSGQVVAYDSNRGVYILPGMGYSGYYQTWEYDLSILTTYLDTIIPENPAFSYDPIIDKCILPRGPTAFDVWMWDGATWTEIDPPSTPINQYFASVFSPAHGGILYVTTLHLLLFHNYSWEYLIEIVQSKDDMSGSRLVYNSQEDRVYAFLYIPYDPHISVFQLVNHKHDIPFHKP
ncbi:MAG TPA: hypothetical protein PK014_03065 [Thermoanaerobaculia bacterium]|nr:hypothetical protein [Thermoanaerobaculia bacterium]HUM29038.1 hypothetical protein [Thermoanaerobaculia bacterium]HXK67406.1 hypothetical protein [Thermoanaerobaculia bacterium]